MKRAEDLAIRFVDQAVLTWVRLGFSRELLAHALTARGLSILAELEGAEVWAGHLEDLAQQVREIANDPPEQKPC